MNELAIQQYYIYLYDRWEGFEAERQRVLPGLQGVKNVIFLTTDVHATLINDARFQTLESGGPKDSGIIDVDRRPRGDGELRARDRRCHRRRAAESSRTARS